MKRFDLSRDGDQVQALVRSGFASLNHCRYQLLEISDRRLAARWIDKLLTAKLVKSAADMEQEARFSEVVQLAFTHRGLAAPSALALPIADEFPFPTIFARGMNSRPQKPVTMPATVPTAAPMMPARLAPARFADAEAAT